MDKIRVLHVIQNLNTGGLERIAAQIASGLDKNKFEAELWCLSGGGALEKTFKDKIPVIKLFDYRRYLLPWNIVKLSAQIKHGNFDIVHTHSYAPGIIGRLSARMARVKVVFHHHHSISSSSMNGLNRIFERFVTSYLTDSVIACSNAAKEFILRENFAKEDKISVIYNGVPEEFVAPSGSADSLKSELALKGSKVLISVGSLTPHKAHIYLLQALNKIIKVLPLVKLIIVGEGPERPRLEKFIYENNLSSNVILTGNKNDVKPYLEIADIFILPSLLESMSISCAEAMAKALPVVAFSTGGVLEVVQDGETGLLAETGNTDELAGKILYFLNNEAIAVQMGQNGLARYKRLFNLNIMIDKIQNLYLKYLDKQCSPDSI